MATLAPSTECAVLKQAAKALQDADTLQERLTATQGRLRDLCRLYDDATGSRGTSPDGLRRACRMGGLL